MTTLFSDTFESGDLSAWTGSDADGGTIAVVSGAAHAGSFGLRVDNTSGSGGAYVYRDVSEPVSAIASLQVWLKVVSASGTGTFRVAQLSNSVLAILRLEFINNAWQLWFRKEDFSIETTPVTGILANTWQLIELTYDWTGPPVATITIDGVTAAVLNDSTFGADKPINRVFLLAFQDTAPATGNLYFDELRLDDAFIGGGSPPAGGQPLASRRRGSTEPTGAHRIGRGW